VVVFHAGTKNLNRRVVTAGGRVLGVTAVGNDIKDAITKAYKAVGHIDWDGKYYRNDIGHRALQRLEIKGGPQVGIVMGSDSDLPVMQAAADFLDSMGISWEMRIISAHRTPHVAAEYAETASGRGLRCIIAGAGMAAHLAGVMAAHTTVPVIGVPIDASSLQGLDALLATVQMPPGIPVATMGIGKSGAKNAAIFATRMMGTTDDVIGAALADYAADMARQVMAKDKKLNP
jgi:phosphoribosylamine--glycine ligase